LDRLVAAVAWNEPQSLAQALLVASHQSGKLDRDKLDKWVLREDITADKELVEFYRKIERILPT